MTNFKIERLPFDADAISVWSKADERHTNWPVVYTISADDEIYVGETLSVANRLQQHLSSEERRALKKVRIVFNDTFNKSVCLDLESHLIRYFHADGTLKVQNRNTGITDADYFNRDQYRESFDELFDELLKEGLLTRSIPDIVNSNLFKFSPFKALNTDQAAAVDEILEIFFEDLGSGWAGAWWSRVTRERARRSSPFI
jgi:predicted GIY-YIG superfamily endonuclease